MGKTFNTQYVPEIFKKKFMCYSTLNEGKLSYDKRSKITVAQRQ